MRWLISSSLRFRVLVLGIAAAVMFVGVTQLRDAPVDVLPEFTPPYVEVQTEALGLSANEVEQLITVPLEADLLNGVEGVETIRSESVPGLSSVVLVFARDSDLYQSRQLVQEALTQAHALPNVSKPPTMLQPLSSSSRLMMIGLSSDRLSAIERSVLARWTIKPRLMGVPGVANVALWGQRERQLQVQVDPAQLRRRKVTLNQVVATTGNAQVVSPLSFLEASTPGTGGFIETAQQRLQVRHVFDKLATPEQLGQVPVEGTGGRLRLTDVANVVEDHQPLIGDAVVNDGEGMLLVVEKFPGANTLEVTKGVESALEDLKPGLAGLETDSTVFRPATFIEDMIGNVTMALIIGGALLLVALAALLTAWRTVLVAVVAIAVSLVAAALVLDLRGESMNAIAFAGLAVALIVVIDDAVASVDAVARRLRRRREEGSDASAASTVLEASQEIRGPLMYATLIVVAVMVPVLVIEGRPGAFLSPLALSYLLAVLASLLVALTVTPALSLLLLAKPPRREGRGSPVLGWLHPRYAGGLMRILGRPGRAALVAAACVVVALAALPLMGSSLIPSFKDKDVLVRLNGAPGTSQPEMTRVAAQVGRELRAIPGINNVGAHVGRAITGDQVVDVNAGDLWVTIDSKVDYDETMAAIDRVVARLPVEHTVITNSEQEIRDVGALVEGDNPATGDGFNVLTGADKPLTVRVFGENLDVLRTQANTVRQAISGIDGVVDPQVDLPPTERALEIEVDLAKAQRFGIKPGDVRRANATLLQGIQVGSIFEDQKVFEVIVQGAPSMRRSVDSVRGIRIDRPDGGSVRLGDVADVRVVPTPSVIQRDAVSRRLDVEAGIDGRSLGDVTADVEERLASLRFPLEYHAEVVDANTAEEIGSSQLVGFVIAAALATFLLLQAAFRSWRVAALAFLALPVALVGGVVAALIGGGGLTLGSFLGFLALLALAARSSVVLVRRLQVVELEDGRAVGPDRVRVVAQERLAPTLLTAAATGAVLLPFVVMGGIPGLEIVNPMAIVVLGGLVSSTALSLYVLPALYLRFGAGSHLGRDPDEVDPGGRGEPDPANGSGNGVGAVAASTRV
jgi:CzcA family heavy metal efflux pump